MEITQNIKVIQAFCHTYLWTKRAKQALDSLKNPSLSISTPAEPSRLQKLCESADMLIARFYFYDLLLLFFRAKSNEGMFKAILIIQSYFRKKRIRIKARENEAILWKRGFACEILQVF